MTDVVGVDEAVTLLTGGSVVAVPTDTVYGVAASIDQPEAIARLFQLKRRPSSVALPVLVSSSSAIEALGVQWPEAARELAEAFWPGALTIVVPVEPQLAAKVGAVASVGFRIPNDATLLSVLERCGPLAVSSANEHGEPPCQSSAEVLSALDATELTAVLDDGVRSGDVSTVVELTATGWNVLRAGRISAEAIGRVLG